MGRRQFTQNETFWEKYLNIVLSWNQWFFEYLIGVIDVDVVVLRWWKNKTLGDTVVEKKKGTLQPYTLLSKKLQRSILQESWDILEIDSNIHFPRRFAV